MYRGIIFDLDGTLLDTSEGVLSSVRHTIKTMGYRELPEETLLTFIGPPVKRSLMEHYGLDDAEADRATAVFRDQYKNVDLLKARPYDGILPLLDRLKSRGFLIGVATLKREDYALTILEPFGIAERCDLICGSDFASKMQKVDVLHKCLDGLNLSPKEALLIGDTASDAGGAKAAGTDFMAVTFGFGPKTKKEWEERYSPVFTAERVSEIAEFLGAAHL